MSQQQQLSNKDGALFRQVVKHFENKQYKKGLKTADQVLKKNPNHADTQAMKALIMSHQGQEEEAFALAKTALNNNMKSHVCWHVYGLLYRAVKNYDESIKAYKFALRLDPESQPIQRDLADLQIQMRDYQGYVQSRKNMLQQRPGFRQNWTALAIAHHLAGDYEDAENVLNTYEDTLKQPPPRSDLEHSEAVLYKNVVIAESGETEKALEHLEAVGNKCADVLAVMEMKAAYLLRLGKMPEAEAAYMALIERNPDNSEYFDGWEKAKESPEKDNTTIKIEYKGLAEKYPRADAPRRRPLDFLTGVDFCDAADIYLQKMLRKGVPSTFANIKRLYEDDVKRKAIEDLVEGYAAGKFRQQINGSTENATNGQDSSFESFVYYFLAQHYSHRASRDLDKADEFIEKALSIDPQSVDFAMTKARIEKYRGNLAKAAELMEKARSLDEKDRAINTKSAKYQLRNDENDKALKTMSKFTRNETAGGPLGDLHDMQCIWFITEDGISYLRQRKLGLALKRFHAALTIFETWQEDQFNFHNFSLRKGMIRAYVDMLRWEDRLREHPYYAKMAIPAVQAYVLLHDHPELAYGSAVSTTNGGSEGMEEAEKKKALKKAKQQQQKQEKAEAEKRELMKASKANAKGADGEIKKEDTDPSGKKLAETKDPLADAMKFLTPLLEFNSNDVEAQCAGFEVFIRRKKYVLALKCLLAAHAISPEHPTLLLQLEKYRELLKDIPPKVTGIIGPEIKSLLPST